MKSVGTPFADRIPRDMKNNLKWRRNMQKKALGEPEYCDGIRDACSQDPIFFMNGFAWTYDPRGKPFPRLPFILYPFQEEVLLDLINSIAVRDVLIEKSRDMGASWLCVSAVFWQWMFVEMQSLLFVSRVEDYVDKAGNPKALFWKFDFLLEHLPGWMLPMGYNVSEHRRKMHIENPENGSVVDGESTTGRVARGDRRSAIVLDEFAAVEQGHKVLFATRDATPCRIFNSTPEGINNAFYDVRQKGNIKKHRLHWTLHPLKSRGLYTANEDGTLKIIDKVGYPLEYHPILDGKTRSPWYDLQCERAASPQEIAQELDIDYLGSGYQFFSQDSIDEAIRKSAKPPLAVGDLTYDELTAEPIRFREDPNGSMKLWFFLGEGDKPPAGIKYSIGVDVSAGTGSSNSCISGWNNATGEKVLEFTSPYVRPENLAKQAVAISLWLKGDQRPGSAFLIWESNGPGRQFGSRVGELGYGNVYYRKQEESITKKVSKIPGWASTKEGKLVLLGDYRNAIEKGKCINRSKEALAECLEYVFAANGGVEHGRAQNKSDPTGAGASHGDRVIADALAYKGMRERVITPKQEEPEIPVGCLAWRRKMRERENARVNGELGREWN